MRTLSSLLSLIKRNFRVWLSFWPTSNRHSLIGAHLNNSRIKVNTKINPSSVHFHCHCTSDNWVCWSTIKTSHQSIIEFHTFCITPVPWRVIILSYAWAMKFAAYMMNFNPYVLRLVPNFGWNFYRQCWVSTWKLFNEKQSKSNLRIFRP